MAEKPPHLHANVYISAKLREAVVKYLAEATQRGEPRHETADKIGQKSGTTIKNMLGTKEYLTVGERNCANGFGSLLGIPESERFALRYVTPSVEATMPPVYVDDTLKILENETCWCGKKKPEKKDDEEDEKYLFCNRCYAFIMQNLPQPFCRNLMYLPPSEGLKEGYIILKHLLKFRAFKCTEEQVKTAHAALLALSKRKQA